MGIKKLFGYWVYTITTPDGMVYVGVSMRHSVKKRWQKSGYETTSLYPYIEKWGWENLEKRIVRYGLSKEKAYELEEELIMFCDLNGVRINERHSGLVTLDENGNRDLNGYFKKNGYKSQYKYIEKHKEEHRERCRINKKKWIETHREEWNKICLRNYYKRKWNKQLKELGYITLF